MQVASSSPFVVKTFVFVFGLSLRFLSVTGDRGTRVYKTIVDSNCRQLFPPTSYTRCPPNGKSSAPPTKKMLMGNPNISYLLCESTLLKLTLIPICIKTGKATFLKATFQIPFFIIRKCYQQTTTVNKCCEVLSIYLSLDQQLRP